MKRNKKEVLEKWNALWQKHLAAHKFIWLFEEDLYTDFLQKFSLIRCNSTLVDGFDEIYIYFEDESTNDTKLTTEAVLFKERGNHQYLLKKGNITYRTFPPSSPVYALVEDFPWRVFKNECERAEKTRV